MGNPILTKTFLSYSIDAGNSFTPASGYPLANIQDYDDPQVETRTNASTGDSTITIDLGAVKTNLTVYIDNINSDTIKYQESATAGGAPTDLTANLSVTDYVGDGIYSRIDNLTLSSKQYLKIFIPSGTPVDGASYWSIGAFVISESLTTLDDPFLQNLRFTIADNTIKNRFGNGKERKLAVDGGYPERLFSINYETDNSSTYNISGQGIRQYINLARDTSSLYLLNFNLADPAQAFLGYFDGEVNAELTSPNSGVVNFGSFIFRVTK